MQLPRLRKLDSCWRCEVTDFGRWRGGEWVTNAGRFWRAESLLARAPAGLVWPSQPEPEAWLLERERPAGQSRGQERSCRAWLGGSGEIGLLAWRQET